MESNIKKSNSIFIIILVIVIIGLGGFIIYDKLIAKDNSMTTNAPTNETLKDNAQDENENNNHIDLEKKINNGNRTGNYSLFMSNKKDGFEYSLMMFSTNEKNKGFFTLTEASSMSYNCDVGGYYEIKDGYIEFYNNMSDEGDKNLFVNTFNMQVSDLYQDPQAVKEGYQIQYRLKLSYNEDKISNSALTFEKIY